MRSTPVESVSMKTKDGRQSKCANENRIIKYKKIEKHGRMWSRALVPVIYFEFTHVADVVSKLIM